MKLSTASFLLFTLLLGGFANAQVPLSTFYDTDAPEVIAPGIVSTQNGEYSPTFDPIRGELFFMRRTPGQFDYTIYLTRLTPAGWSEPEIAPFSGEFRDAAPYLAPDGNTLFFDSKRPAEGLQNNSINLWATARNTTGWDEPALLRTLSENGDDEPVAGRDEFGPAVDGAGKLYFYTFRRPYREGARYASAPDYTDFQIDRDVPDPSANTFVSYLYISPDGNTAIIEGRALGRRDTDLFCATRKGDGSWTAARPLSRVNTEYGEGGPFLTADGKYLLFTSDRPTTSSKAGSANLYLIETTGLFPRNAD